MANSQSRRHFAQALALDRIQVGHERVATMDIRESAFQRSAMTSPVVIDGLRGR